MSDSPCCVPLINNDSHDKPKITIPVMNQVNYLKRIAYSILLDVSTQSETQRLKGGGGGRKLHQAHVTIFLDKLNRDSYI